MPDEVSSQTQLLDDVAIVSEPVVVERVETLVADLEGSGESGDARGRRDMGYLVDSGLA